MNEEKVGGKSIDGSQVIMATVAMNFTAQMHRPSNNDIIFNYLPDD